MRRQWSMDRSFLGKQGVEEAFCKNFVGSATIMIMTIFFCQMPKEIGKETVEKEHWDALERAISLNMACAVTTIEEEKGFRGHMYTRSLNAIQTLLPGEAESLKLLK
ncbi:hypothetical protein ACH5RR_013385 [Cinchona calisaya]|uniref:Uncharacterized protein n=1 Tax=Cinchona calisaya TaxID=153742 RepID=A0ABD3A0C9_9GENT